MKKVLRVLLVVVIILVAGVAAIALYVKTALPDVGDAPNMKIAATPERIARGKYIANHVSVCMDCHSRRDWSMYAGPLKMETFGGGGEKFDKTVGIPGTLYSRNITPYSLHNWSDGEIYRAITCGQSKAGNALFPLMGYKGFSHMSQEDVYSVIAYLRTLTPVKNTLPERSLDFPVNFIVNTVPAKVAAPPAVPDTNNAVAYGRYLVTIANCVECHSQAENGNVVPGSEFGGGRAFQFPNGTFAHSANISPDKETGIGAWSESDFVNRFKQYANPGYEPKHLSNDDFNTPMPWMMYAGMTSKDLSAIYRYLRTVKPLTNRVQHFTKS